MTTTTTIIPKEFEYLSDVYQELPKNCLFNKGATGAGGTTIALRDNKPTVICVPSVELINNKVLQATENKNDFYPYKLLGVHSKIKDLEIADFLMNNAIPKIMVTYDSLKRIADLIDPSAYNILVDEYHSLFTEYSFRNPAVMTVLNNYTRFKNFTFMSATPIGGEFLLDELMGIDMENAVWEKVVDVTVKAVKCENGIIKSVKTLVDRVLSGELEGNYYLFVNSLIFIEKVIKICNLNETNCRVIYSADNPTVLKLPKGKTTDLPKKINFLTKTAFNGCDIFDEEGKICIISDGRKAHTLIDISTQFIQIAGRIRDSRYRNAIFHLYTSTRYSGKISYTDFAEMVREKVESEDSYYKNIQILEPKNRAKATEVGMLYYRRDKATQTLIPDKNRQKIDLYNYKILNEDYMSKVNLANAYETHGLSSVAWFEDSSNPEILPMDDIKNFKDTVVTLKEKCKGDYVGSPFLVRI